jgi:hypothetical protein
MVVNLKILRDSLLALSGVFLLFDFLIDARKIAHQLLAVISKQLL